MVSSPMEKQEMAMPDLTFSLDDLSRELRTVRAQWREARGRDRDYGEYGFPSRQAIKEILESLRAALFPIRLGPAGLTRFSEDSFVTHSLRTALPALEAQIVMELASRAWGEGNLADDMLHRSQEAQYIVQELARRLPQIRRMLDTDVDAAFAGDPAARSVDEVLLCYPCVTAMMHHRVAHELYLLGAPLVARIVAEIAHSLTGIDIHPGAEIGESFFIDHGTGVVIGQTAIIGRGVRIYQAVTLGARSFRTDDAGMLVKDEPRHPIVEDNVTIYAGATLLGRITIGAGSVIGGNVWLTRSVPAGSEVRQMKPRVDIEGGEKA